MGSINSVKKANYSRRKLGKIDAHLTQKLQTVKWAEFLIGDLFEIKTSKKRFDANKIQLSEQGHPYVVRTASNNGIKGFLKENEEYLNEGNTISFGQDTATMFYQKQPYFTGDKIKVLQCKYTQFSKLNAIFIIPTLERAFSSFSWGSSSFNVKVIEETKITLPTHNGAIDFAFMETFIAELEAQRIAELEAQRIAELEAYLTVTGLKDYTLTEEEEKVLNSLDKVQWKEYRFADIFNNIQQGRRLKKDDQIEGSIPFVMAGVTNTGIVNYISNPVATFPKNSITIDIFGNAFYRNYDFGAGDDTGVYWNTERKLSREMMLFLTKTSEKALQGKFSYGKKLRSSQSLNFRMKLPTKNGTPDYDFMNTYISAIHKVVIKEVVLYAEKKIQATKEVIKK